MSTYINDAHTDLNYISDAAPIADLTINTGSLVRSRASSASHTATAPRRPGIEERTLLNTNCDHKLLFAYVIAKHRPFSS